MKWVAIYGVFAAVIVVAGAILGFAMPVAVLAVVLGIGRAIWKLRPRVNGGERRGPRAER
jgi:hypothetical protein